MDHTLNPAKQRRLQTRRWLVLIAGLLLVFCLSIFIGRYPQPYWMPLELLGEDELARQLVTALRLPRLLTALMLGASLAAAGNVLQMVFRNPLVGPGILGVSQGAGFGAALAILTLSSRALAVELSAFVFACLGLALSYLIARQLRYGGWVLRLILSGIAVSALFSAGIGLIKYLADPFTQLPEITFWLLGGLWGVTWQEVFLMAPFDWEIFPHPAGASRSFNWAYVFILLPAALGALIIGRNPGPQTWVLLLLPASVLIQSLIFYGSPRFRLITEPIALIAAAVGILVISGAVKRLIQDRIL